MAGMYDGLMAGGPPNDPKLWDGLMQRGSYGPVFQGGLSDPDWIKNLPPVYSEFRKSNNIEDRRNDSFLQNWGGALLAGMQQLLPTQATLSAAINHPLTRVDETLARQSPEVPLTPLSIAAGAADLRAISGQK